MSTNVNKPVFDPAAMAQSLALLGAGAASAPAAPAKEKATAYLSIGYLPDDVSTDSADWVDHLINLPQMQGLDNMNPDTRRANTPEFAQSQADQNAFLEELKEQTLATLQPGERRVLPFYVTVYRKKDEIAVPTRTERPKANFFGKPAE